jgi:hypothetical protein
MGGLKAETSFWCFAVDFGSHAVCFCYVCWFLKAWNLSRFVEDVLSWSQSEFKDDARRTKLAVSLLSTFASEDNLPGRKMGEASSSTE